jgi:hypothetical protein
MKAQRHDLRPSPASTFGRKAQLTRTRPYSLAVTLLGVTATLLIALSVRPLGAQAAPSAESAWSIIASGVPSVFSEAQNAPCEAIEDREVSGLAESCDRYSVVVTNVGSKASSGLITVTDALPPGVTTASSPGKTLGERTRWSCTEGAGQTEFTCTTESRVAALSAANAIEVPVYVTAAPGSVLTNRVRVSGGEAPKSATAEETSRVSANTEPFVTEILPFSLSSFRAGALDRGGVDATQAGSHPGGLVTNFTVPTFWRNLNGSKTYRPNPVEEMKQVVVDLPPGLVGDALAAPRCPLTGLDGATEEHSNCPPASRVGMLVNESANGSETELELFNLVPERGFAAEFGAYLPSLQRSETLYATVAGSGADTHIRVISAPQNGLPETHGVSLTFFGNPSKTNTETEEVFSEQERTAPTAPTAFATTPSDCQAPGFNTVIHVDSWQDPGALNPDGSPDLADPAWKSSTSASPPVGGCEFLQFKPTISFKPEATSSDSPTGLKVNIHVPQNEAPEGLATPPLREATVALPKGLAVDPSSADGLAGCTPAQIAAETNDPGTCPRASQIGEVEISTPLLDHPLPGKVYLGTPECAPCSNADAQAGKLVELYIEVNDPISGVIVKLPGSGSLDPATGQITATFKENPQLPFEDLNLSFKGGPRATLTTPPTCGTYTTTTDLKPWSAPQSGPDATPSSRFELTSGPNGSACPNGEAGLSNSPSFEAGTTNPIAGSYSPFVLKLSREDGSQRFSSIDTTLPEGLLARLAGIPYCSDQAIAAAGGRSGAAEKASPSCPAASEVGVVNVGAGSGTPYYVQGKAYLAGPYKGAPLSLAIITPAVAGPFDLGTVVVRTALFVNEFTAQVYAVSDPLPQSLAGIPLDVRSIALQLNRPDFTLNPTSCEAKEITGSMISALGQSAPLKNNFAVGACAALQFKPGLKISLNGQTRRVGHPALKAVLTYPKGQNANVKRALVNLPGSEFLDQGNLNKTCTKPVLIAGKCPKTTIYGKAKAWTPLEEAPMEGPVYLVGGFGYKLPALVAELNGQIKVFLVGKVDSGKNKGIRNTFEAVPDAPVSRFVLEMKGGKKYGLLENSQNICKHRQKAIARFTAQNGKTYDTEPVIAVQCGKGKKKHR